MFRFAFASAANRSASQNAMGSPKLLVAPYGTDRGGGQLRPIQYLRHGEAATHLRNSHPEVQVLRDRESSSIPTDLLISRAAEHRAAMVRRTAHLFNSKLPQAFLQFLTQLCNHV